MSEAQRSSMVHVGPPKEQRQLPDVLSEFGPGLRRMVGAYVTDVADREDLFQEISIALWRSLPQFRGESSLRTFVHRVARNRCLTFQARSRRRRARELRIDFPDDLWDNASGELLLSEAIEVAQLSDRLRTAIGELPRDLRRTVLLRLDGLSDREIGGRLGITPNATAVRLFRARQHLRELIDPGDFGRSGSIDVRASGPGPSIARVSRD